MRCIDAGKNTYCSRVQHITNAEHHIANVHVITTRTNSLPHLHRSAEHHFIWCFTFCGIFHHHHCIGATWHWSTRHDARCFTWAHCNMRNTTCSNFIDHSQGDGNICNILRTNGEAIDCTICKMRYFFLRNDVLGEHQPICMVQRNGDRRSLLHCTQYFFLGRSEFNHVLNGTCEKM